MADDLYVQTEGDAKLPRDNEGKIMPLDYGAENRGTVDETQAMDFGKMLLVDFESAESISNKFGATAELGSSDSYWNDAEIQEAVVDAYGEKDAKENFDMIYRNLEGEYAKYLQQDFEAESIARNMAGATTRGQVNKAKKTTPIVRSVIKDMTGGAQFGDRFYGQKRSTREAQVQKVRLQTGEDADNNPIFELLDLTPELKAILDEREDIDGFAYNKIQSRMGENPRAQGFVDVIISGKVWDDANEDFVDVRNDQIVAQWDIDDGSLFHTLLKGNGMDMEGIDYAKILIRSPLNTALEFFDIIPQVGRSIIAGWEGENVEQSSLYNRLTSLGIRTKGYKASTSDAALKGGFFGNAEMFTSTIADVASQLVLAGAVGKMMSRGVGLYARSAEAMGASLSSKRAVKGMQSIVGNTTRLSLTMMASKDMYQEALEHGFSKREAGFAMGATVWAMWKANALSGYMTDGIEPSAARYFSSKFAKSHMDDALGAIDKGFIKEIGAKGWMNRMKGLDNAFGKAFASVEKKLATDMTWHAAAREASEEIFEELSTVGVRQMMNEYRAFRGDNLREMAIGEGRFKSYWDPGFWSELAEHLLVSGVAGGFGGVIGKTMHGGAKVSTLTDSSSLLDFALAKEGNVLRKQIYDAAKENAYGPAGLTTQQDTLTGAYQQSKHSGGKTMNDMVRDSLLQDLTVMETFVADMGLDAAKDMLEGDPALKLHMEETSLLADVKTYATELRKLMDDTGVGTKTLLALEDGDVNDHLVAANDDRAVQMVRMNKEVEDYKVDIQELNDLKTKIHAKEADAKAKSKDSKKDAPSKFTEAQQDKLDALEIKRDEKQAIIDNVQGEVAEADLVKIEKLLRNIRGINNGSAAETYYLQHTLFADTVFGSMQNRDQKFKKYGADFFRKTFANARSTMADINKENLTKVRKGLDNDKRLLQMTTENLDKFADIFESQPQMSKETLKHLFDIYEQITKSDLVSNLQREYVQSDSFLDKSISLTLAQYDNAVFEDVSETSLTPDQKITTVLQTPGKAIWSMTATGKTTLAADGKHVDFDEYLDASTDGNASIRAKMDAAKVNGNNAEADTILSNAWEAARAAASEQGKTLLGSEQDLIRLSTEGKVTLDSTIGIDSFGEYLKRVGSDMSAVEAKKTFNDNISALGSLGDSTMYTDQFLGDLNANKQTEDPTWLVDVETKVPKKLIEFTKTAQFRRLYKLTMEQFATTIVKGDIAVPLIDLEEGVEDTFRTIIESDDFTGVDEDFYEMFGYNPLAVAEYDFLYNYNLYAMQSPNGIAEFGKSTPEAVALQKDYLSALNADDSVQKIQQYMAVVADKSVGLDFNTMSKQVNIDPEIPKLYSPFQLMWMDKGLTGGVNSDFETSGDGLLEKVVILAQKIEKNEDNTAFELPSNDRVELQKVQEQLEIRQAQRDILGYLMTSPPHNPNLPENMQEKSEVKRIAAFRDNIYKIIGDNNYPLKPRFSGEEDHMYKNHSELSDFINDFIYDPRVILDIETKITKSKGQDTLTEAELKLYSEYEQFVYNLYPIRNDAAIKAGTAEEVQDMVEDIIDFRGLVDGIKFMGRTHSMEQGLEIIKGLNFLLDTYPSTKIKGGIAGRTFLDKRHKVMTNKFIGLKHGINTFKESYDKKSLPLPEDFKDVTLYASTWDEATKMTDDDYVQLEQLLIKFFKVLPQIKKDIPEIYDSKLFGNDGGSSTELKLFGDYDVSSFYSQYKEYLEDAMKNDGQVPLAEQELNALYLNAFILTDGKIKSSIAHGGKYSHIFVVSGLAGTGKSHVVAKLGIGLAQRQQAVQYSKEVTKVMVASNHPAQIRNMDVALASSNVETSGKGKTFDELIGTLKSYVDGSGGPSVEAEVDSTSVIVFDEYTGINAKSKRSLQEGEKSIYTLQELMDKVNEMKKVKSLSRSAPFPTTKLILLGDESQMGFSDDSGVPSSMDSVIQEEGYFKGIVMKENMRASNIYLSDALDKLRMDYMSMNAFNSYSGKENDENVGKYAKVSFASQKAVGGRFMGMQSTTKSFKDILYDTALARNIEDQIAYAENKKEDFTVGIIPDNLHSMDYESPVGKLVLKYKDTFVLKTTESIIQEIETDKVQGLEFNYVITEYSKEFARDMAVVPEAKDNIKKVHYTLASRAKDFVVVSNTSNAPIVSTKTDEQLILSESGMTKENKQLAYDHIMKVLENVDTATSSNTSTTVASEEISEDNISSSIDTETAVGVVATTAIHNLIKSKVTDLVATTGKEFTDEEDLISTFRILMGLSKTGLADVFNNESQPDDFTDEGFKWVINNKVQLRAILADIELTTDNELNRIASVFDTVIIKVNAARVGSDGHSKVQSSEQDAFTKAVEQEIKEDHTDIKLESKDAQKVLSQRIVNHLMQVNVDTEGTAGSGQNVTEDGYSTQGEKVETKEETLIRYQKALTDYGSLSAIVAKKDELGILVVSGIATVDEVQEFNMLTKLLTSLEAYGIVLTPPTNVNFTPTKDSNIAAIFTEDKEKLLEVQTVRASELHNMKMNQAASGRKIQLLNTSQTMDDVNSEEMSPLHKAELTSIVEELGISIDDLGVSSGDVHSAIHFGDDKFAKVQFVGKMFTNQKGTQYPIAAIIGTTAEGKHVSLGRVMLGITPNQLTKYKLKGEELKEALGLDHVIDANTSRNVVENLLYPTNYALKQKILANNGKPVVQKLNVNKVNSTMTMGAGYLQPTNTKVSFNEFRRNAALNYNVQISKHIMINKGEYMKGVAPGAAFVLYTTNPHLRLDDINVIFSLLAVAATSGDGKIASNIESKFRTDVGFIPLDGVQTTLNSIYRETAKNNKENKVTQHSRHLVYNDMLNGLGINFKVAKIMAELAKHMLGKNELHASLLDDVMIASKRAAGAKGDITYSPEIIKSLEEGLERVSYVQSTDGNLAQSLSTTEKVDFFKNLDPSEALGPLAHRDILHAIFTPFLRNVRSKSADAQDGVKGSASLYSITGGTSYAGDYTAMYGESTNPDDGTTTGAFNTLDMLESIRFNLFTKLGTYGKGSGDEGADLANAYMEKLVLPVLSDIIGKSALTGRAAAVQAKVANKEATILTKAFVFQASAVGKAGFTKDKEGGAFIASSIFRDSKDNEFNGEFVGTNIARIGYPNVTFSGEFLLDELNKRKVPPLGGGGGPLVDMNEVLVKSITGLYTAAEKIVTDAKEEADLIEAENALSAITSHMDEELPEVSGLIRKAAMTEASRALMAKKAENIQKAIDKKRKEFNKKPGQHEVYITPLADLISLKTLTKTAGKTYEDLQKIITEESQATTDKIQVEITNKAVRTDLLNELTEAKNKALAELKKKFDAEKVVLDKEVKVVDAISLTADSSKTEKSVANVKLGVSANKLKRAYFKTAEHIALLAKIQALNTLTTTKGATEHVPTIQSFSITAEGDAVDIIVTTSDTSSETLTITVENGETVIVDSKGKAYNKESLDLLITDGMLRTSLQNYLDALKLQQISGEEMTQAFVDAITDLQKTLIGGAAVDNDHRVFKVGVKKPRVNANITDIFTTFTYLSNGHVTVINSNLNGLAKDVSATVINTLTNIKTHGYSIDNLRGLTPLLESIQKSAKNPKTLQSLMDSFRKELNECK